MKSNQTLAYPTNPLISFLSPCPQMLSRKPTKKKTFLLFWFLSFSVLGYDLFSIFPACMIQGIDFLQSNSPPTPGGKPGNISCSAIFSTHNTICFHNIHKRSYHSFFPSPFFPNLREEKNHFFFPFLVCYVSRWMFLGYLIFRSKSRLSKVTIVQRVMLLRRDSGDIFSPEKLYPIFKKSKNS